MGVIFAVFTLGGWQEAEGEEGAEGLWCRCCGGGDGCGRAEGACFFVLLCCHWAHPVEFDSIDVQSCSLV